MAKSLLLNGSSISVSALTSGNYYIEITLKDSSKKSEKLIVEQKSIGEYEHLFNNRAEIIQLFFLLQTYTTILK